MEVSSWSIRIPAGVSVEKADSGPEKVGPELAKSVKFSVSRKEATKSVRWMPRRQEPMKDAVHCEKPRGAVCRRRTGGIRMGKPGWLKTSHAVPNTYAQRGNVGN